MRAAALTEHGEPLAVEEVDRPEAGPEQVVSEAVGLEDVSDRLEAMTDFETEGIPVVTEFSA